MQAEKVDALPVPQFIGGGPASTSDYIFIHADMGRKWYLKEEFLPHNYYRIYAIPNALSILAYREQLIYAKEIHVLDSCLLHLLEHFPIRGKIFYHRYSRPGSIGYDNYRHPLTTLGGVT